MLVIRVLFAPQVVERKTLKRLMPTTWSVIKALPRTLQLQVGGSRSACCCEAAAAGGQEAEAAIGCRWPEREMAPASIAALHLHPFLLQEPAFKEVVVLYRTAAGTRTGTVGE